MKKQAVILITFLFLLQCIALFNFAVLPSFGSLLSASLVYIGCLFSICLFSPSFACFSNFFVAKIIKACLSSIIIFSVPVIPFTTVLFFGGLTRDAFILSGEIPLFVYLCIQISGASLILLLSMVYFFKPIYFLSKKGPLIFFAVLLYCLITASRSALAMFVICVVCSLFSLSSKGSRIILPLKFKILDFTAFLLLVTAAGMCVVGLTALSGRLNLADADFTAYLTTIRSYSTYFAYPVGLADSSCLIANSYFEAFWGSLNHRIPILGSKLVFDASIQQNSLVGIDYMGITRFGNVLYPLHSFVKCSFPSFFEPFVVLASTFSISSLILLAAKSLRNHPSVLYFAYGLFFYYLNTVLTRSLLGGTSVYFLFFVSVATIFVIRLFPIEFIDSDV